MLADVSRALREEERLAWQRLIRVLGHEINNSLTPINSLAERLSTLLQRSPPEGELREDLQRGLGVIANRSEGLDAVSSRRTRAREASAAEIREREMSRRWVQRVVRLETRLPVEIVPGPQMTLQADGDQLDQLLINLIANAVDAAQSTGGGVRVRWTRIDGNFELSVQDDGPGSAEFGEPVRSLLHDEAGRNGNRSRALAPDRGGAWGPGHPYE